MAMSAFASGDIGSAARERWHDSPAAADTVAKKLRREIEWFRSWAIVLWILSSAVLS